MSLIEKLTVPTLILDQDRCRNNIAKMCRLAIERDTILRPHFKTHQSLEIGSWFKDFNIDRITVSSLRMADYFANDGWNDITVAFPVTVREIELINNLARRVKLNLLVEDPVVVRQLEGKLKHGYC